MKIASLNNYSSQKDDEIDILAVNVEPNVMRPYKFELDQHHHDESDLLDVDIDLTNDYNEDETEGINPESIAII